MQKGRGLKMVDLNKLQKDIYQNKVNKGFNITDINKEFCLTYGEVAEAYEAWRKKKDDLGEELADVAIYLMGLSEMLGFDLEEQILNKVSKNKKRVYKDINGVNVRIKDQLFGGKMKKYNVIVVFDKDLNKTLMCKRTKEPYKGMFNLVGGKIERENDGLNEAYRELNEETNITSEDISLIHFMNIEYVVFDKLIEVYYGILNKAVNLIEEVNKLEWVSINDNFFDMNKYAGEGNIGHIIEEIKISMNMH